MMATDHGIAARACAFAAHSNITRTALASLAAALLTACGGGGSSAPDDGCVRADGVQLPGAGNVLSLAVRNDTAQPQRVALAGRVSFDGMAGAGGGISTLVLTDGQSPVMVGQLRAEPGRTAQGAQDIGTDILLPAGAVATWHLAHAPLPAPYGWTALTFGTAELCVR